MNISPLGLVYRWNPRHSFLEARYADSPDQDAFYKTSLIPSLQSMFTIEGEIKCAIAARDEAVTEYLNKMEGE